MKKKDYIYNPKEFRKERNERSRKSDASKKDEKLTLGRLASNAIKLIIVILLFKYGFHAF